MDEVIIESVEEERIVRIRVSNTPVVQAENFLPILPDVIEATVKPGGEVWVTLKGWVAKKDGTRSNRPNKVWYYSDFPDQAPEWLKDLVAERIESRSTE